MVLKQEQDKAFGSIISWLFCGVWRNREQFRVSGAIVSSPRPVTLLGGARINHDVLTTTLSLAPTLVAVDGGANGLVGTSLRPDAVIGDLDSLSDAARAAFAGRIHEVAEQETTDFDKALRNVAAPLVIALGVSGGRLDHELAGLNVLIRHPHRRCIAVGRETLTFLCPPAIRLDLATGTLVSLFPMSETRVRSSGLRWPTEGLRLSPAGRIGTSNAATGPVMLEPDVPGLLVILPSTALKLAAEAMIAAPHVWPDPVQDRPVA